MRGIEGVGRFAGLTLDYRATTDTLYVIGSGRLYRSTGGGDWLALGQPGYPLTALAVDFLDSSIIYGGAAPPATVGELVRSTDGGSTWSHFDTGSPPPDQFGVPRAPVHQILVDPTDLNTLYAFTTHTYRYTFRRCCEATDRETGSSYPSQASARK